MSVTKQAQAISIANQISTFMASLATVQQTAAAISSHYVSNGVGATLAAMPTCAQNADGSLGAADATPNEANPIDTRTTGLDGFSRATLAFNYGAALNLIQAVSALLTGQAVTTQASAVDLLAIFQD